MSLICQESSHSQGARAILSHVLIQFHSLLQVQQECGGDRKIAKPDPPGNPRVLRLWRPAIICPHELLKSQALHFRGDRPIS